MRKAWPGNIGQWQPINLKNKFVVSRLGQGFCQILLSWHWAVQIWQERRRWEVRSRLSQVEESGPQTGLQRLSLTVPHPPPPGTVSCSAQRRALNSLQWLNAITPTQPISQGSKVIPHSAVIGLENWKRPSSFYTIWAPWAKELVLSDLESYWQRSTSSVCLYHRGKWSLFSLNCPTLKTYTVTTLTPSLWFSKQSILVT